MRSSEPFIILGNEPQLSRGRTPPIYDDEAIGDLTWEIILSMEPRLQKIINRINAIKATNLRIKGKSKLHYKYATDCWYGRRGYEGIIEQMEDIIGWTSNNPHKRLRTQEAHSICYDHLFGLLTK